MKKVFYFLFILPLLFACSESSDEDEIKPIDNTEYKAAEAYFNSTLKSVINTNCVSCHTNHHNQSNSSNYSVLTNAINSASTMYNQVNSGNMPKDADKLSQSDIDKFKAFLDLVNEIPKH